MEGVNVRLFYAYLLPIFVLIGGPMAITLGANSKGCGFPAVYNFGDSNSDTGGISAAMTQVPPPNGESFFGHPSGRFCDGRLIIDFIGKADSLLVDA